MGTRLYVISFMKVNNKFFTLLNTRMIEKKRFSEAYFECIILYYSILCVYLIAG